MSAGKKGSNVKTQSIGFMVRGLQFVPVCRPGVLHGGLQSARQGDKLWQVNAALRFVRNPADHTAQYPSQLPTGHPFELETAQQTLEVMHLPWRIKREAKVFVYEPTQRFWRLEHRPPLVRGLCPYKQWDVKRDIRV